MNAPTPRITARRGAQFLLLAVPLVILAERSWALRWLSDDGFIHLRVVRQLVSGNGPVWNVGERVEASTSPLWVFVLAGADLVTPIRLEWLAVLGGMGLTIGGVALTMAGSRTLIRPDPGQLLLPVGAALLVGLAPVWIFSSSGLEGGLVTAWMGACLWLLATWARTASPFGAGAAVVIGLGPLIRPELGIFTVAFVAVVLVGQRCSDGWGNRARLLLCVFVLPVTYQLFRMGYYGVLVPNPAIAKEASASYWSEGWTYLKDVLGPYWLWLPLLGLAVGAYPSLLRQLRRDGQDRGQLVVAAFVVGGLLSALYIVRVGGDFFHARLLLPGLMALTAPVSVLPLRRAYVGALVVLPWAVVALLFLRGGNYDRITAHANRVTLSDHGWGSGSPNVERYRAPGVRYHDVTLAAEPSGGRRSVLGYFGIGVAGYALGPDVYLLDLLGLADAFTSHLEVDRRVLAGHDKPLPPPWFVARVTEPGADVDDDDFPFPVFSIPLGDPDGQPLDERVAVARRTLECRDLKTFLARSTAPLTPRRFVRNLIGSPAATSMRIAPEPRDAARQLCD
ncbi:MAG: hypothetical protein M3R01_11655 [Actinomycetota bacterium]|nr:hypothetical protein [Actinomycetota bacterium]